MIGEVWYLLYDGTSEDGRGTPSYHGRSTNAMEVHAWLLKRQNNPYWIGHVLCVNDVREKQISSVSKI